MSTQFYSYNIYKKYINSNNKNKKDLARIIFKSPKFKLPKFQLENLEILRDKLDYFRQFFKLPFDDTVFEIEIDLDRSQLENSARQLSLKLSNITVVCQNTDSYDIIKTINKTRSLTPIDNYKAINLFDNALNFLKNDQNKLICVVAIDSISKEIVFNSFLDLTQINKEGSIEITLIAESIIINQVHADSKNNNTICIDLSSNGRHKNSMDQLMIYTTMYSNMVFGPITYNLLWINCKNNRIHDYQPTNKSFKNQPTVIKNAFSYKILDIYNQVKDCKTEENLKKCIDLNINRVGHMVRGHFKCIKGRLFWWSPHMRNRNKTDFIQRDYQSH